MKIKVGSNLEKFKTVMGMVCNITNEMMFKFNEDEVKIYATLGGLAASYTTFKKDFFDVYEVTGEEEFGLDCKDILTGVTKAKTFFEMYDNEGKVVQKTDKLSFIIPVFDPVEYTDQVPTIEYNNHLDVKLTDITEALKVTKNYTEDEIEFIIKDNKFTLKASKDMREVVVDVSDTEHPNETVKFKKCYAKILEQKSNDTIKLFIENDKPIKITLENELVNFLFFLAPMVD